MERFWDRSVTNENHRCGCAYFKRIERRCPLINEGMSKRVNLSAPAVAERVRKLEDAGIIEGYSVQVNYKKLGLMIDCLLEVTVLNGSISVL